ncbi:MAG TPA: hypothetical protein VG146_11665 [Verrucomicrobiae bacterium]|nr:hypothetical protein [Verrucomicrobiae bacterium]
MIRFIALPYRRGEELEPRHGMRPWLMALVLGLIVFLQLGIVVWLFFSR